MNFTETVSPDSCMAQASGFNCTNRRDEISIGGKHHGDYNIKCTNSTQLVRGSCELPQINVNKTTDSAAFQTFLANQGNFAGRHDLLLDANGDPEVVFLWNVIGERVQALMAFRGEVSWMAVGTENIGGGLRGMKGSHSVMGLSTSDREFPDLSGVHEYKIHDEQSRFRHWNTPYGTPAITDASITSQNGYSAMQFTTDTIFGQKLNVTSGTNRLIWALRASSYMHIGKDSYHEGCNGGERVRYRGGGANHPWIVDFSNTTNEADPTLDTLDTSGCTNMIAGFFAAFIFALVQLSF